MRSVKWCPELGTFTIRTHDGKQKLIGKAEWFDMPMSDDTLNILTQLTSFAESNPNQWVTF